MKTGTLPSVPLTLSKGSLFAECMLAWHTVKKAPVGPFTSSFAESIRKHLAKREPLQVLLA
jgi:hypothetical protein